MKIVCTDWRPCERNSLRGFADFVIVDVELHIRGVAVHDVDGKQLVQLPARPQLDQNRELVHGANGRVRYATILLFDTNEAAAEFNEAALDALQYFNHSSTEPALKLFGDDRERRRPEDNDSTATA